MNNAALHAAPAIADTVRLHRDGAEIVFVFGSPGADVHVNECDAAGNTSAARWSHAAAAYELTMRIRLGWTLVPVAAG
jgi:hypothetical protein